MSILFTSLHLRFVFELHKLDYELHKLGYDKTCIVTTLNYYTYDKLCDTTIPMFLLSAC